MRRTVRLALILSVLAAIVAPAAMAAERMWVGFHDDPSYRWANDRLVRIQRSASDGSTIVRLLVQWNQVAPRRPSNATNPFDSAYRLNDVDEAVRAAQAMDQEVMLTISGTPRWANGGRTPNRMPRNLRDLTNFSRAIAARYSGRYAGYPYVRFWSVWNEPNLQGFLAPQFDGRGRSVAPANYARLYAAAYAGLKAGNASAQVAIGETSARGSDRAAGVRPTHSPGKFAELVARANPRLKFSAWAHHPYPSTPNLRPGQIVRWPNVSLASLPRFQQNLKRWFRQRNPQIWVTEYGHQTRPQDDLGVSYAVQSAYIQQAIRLARKYPFVGMFIWFVYQDDRGQGWESGLYTQGGSAKGGSPGRFSRNARPLDARNSVYAFRRGTATPLVTLHTRRFCVADKPGASIGMTWRIFRGSRLLRVGQQTSPLRRDCTITARLRFPGGGVARGVTYSATFELNDINGEKLMRRLTIRGI
jgi:Cellulase (glycosyl hydrolase family 5)